jgi:hypothetical protein
LLENSRTASRQQVREADLDKPTEAEKILSKALKAC